MLEMPEIPTNKQLKKLIELYCMHYAASGSDTETVVDMFIDNLEHENELVDYRPVKADGICSWCGRDYSVDIVEEYNLSNCECPSDDCPSND